MKKTLSIALVMVLLFLCGSSPVSAVVPGEDSMPSENIPATTDVDELFRLRAQLLMDPNTSQEQFDSIDAQLFALGVEPISAYEVAQKFGNTASPLYDPISTDDTLWTSQRLTNVYNGKQYEIQIITGQMRNSNATNSPLYDTDPGIKKSTHGKQMGAINVLQVIAEDVVTSSISSIPVVGPILTAPLTAYELLHAYNSGYSPTTVIDNADYTFLTVAVSTMRFAFVKYSGAVDAGNQILGYCGTQVNYHVSVTFPYVDENLLPLSDTVAYSDTATSYGFDIYAARAIASQNFWNYKLGQTNLDTHHLLLRIPMVLLDDTYVMDVPYSHP